MKDVRQKAILRILNKSKVSNQEELQSILGEEGIVATQATISRDLKQLKVVKVHEDGRYFFSRSHVPDASGTSPAFRKSSSGVVNIVFSGQFCVIHTNPGYASMVGSVVDANLGGGILGTIAGDDTLLVILEEDYDIEEVKAVFAALFPDIRSILF